MLVTQVSLTSDVTQIDGEWTLKYLRELRGKKYLTKSSSFILRTDGQVKSIYRMNINTNIIM